MEPVRESSLPTQRNLAEKSRGRWAPGSIPASVVGIRLLGAAPSSGRRPRGLPQLRHLSGQLQAPLSLERSTARLRGCSLRWWRRRLLAVGRSSRPETGAAVRRTRLTRIWRPASRSLDRDICPCHSFGAGPPLPPADQVKATMTRRAARARPSMAMTVRGGSPAVIKARLPVCAEGRPRRGSEAASQIAEAGREGWRAESEGAGCC